MQNQTGYGPRLWRDNDSTIIYYYHSNDLAQYRCKTLRNGLIARRIGAQDTTYLHIHYAKPGCYAARVMRAD